MIENEEKTAKYVLLILLAVCLLLGLAEYYYSLGFNTENKVDFHENNDHTLISGLVKSGENLVSIFTKHKLRIEECLMVSEASASVHELGKLDAAKPYKIVVGPDAKIVSFTYWIDDDSLLTVSKTASGFTAEKKEIIYEKRIMTEGGVIRGNLVASIGDDRDHLLLALSLSDILAWDIDFASGLRDGDAFRIVVEGLFLDNKFKKFGNILSAEFVNNGVVYGAYRFEHDGTYGYYDEKGRSLRKAFLRAPLNFRRISSYYSRSRLHPVLKTYRSHHGIDYAAQAGTPVSSAGAGIVSFAGYKGGYGKIVMIRHANGYSTNYGHLSKFGLRIRAGERVKQGQVVGYVGTTGVSTGPHLHYEMLVNNKVVDPLKIKMPEGEKIPEKLMADFGIYRNAMNTRLALIAQSSVPAIEKGGR